MKVIKRGLTILEAKALADKLALETGKVHSVMQENTSSRTRYYVCEGMVGTFNCMYTARPETLRFRRPDKGLPPLFGFPWERKE